MKIDFPNPWIFLFFQGPIFFRAQSIGARNLPRWLSNHQANKPKIASAELFAQELHQFKKCRADGADEKEDHWGGRSRVTWEEKELGGGRVVRSSSEAVLVFPSSCTLGIQCTARRCSDAMRLRRCDATRGGFELCLHRAWVHRVLRKMCEKNRRHCGRYEEASNTLTCEKQVKMVLKNGYVFMNV